jgi:hypothetical protein
VEVGHQPAVREHDVGRVLKRAMVRLAKSGGVALAVERG